MVIGTSTNRNPFATASMSNSDAWYCGCRSVTASVTSTVMARKPDDVSVMRRPVRTVARRPKNREPARRVREAEPWGAGHEVRLTGDQGLQELVDLAADVLPVAVRGDDEARARASG